MGYVFVIVDCIAGDPCMNGASCDTNVCTCATGLTGTLCETGNTQRFLNLGSCEKMKRRQAIINLCISNDTKTCQTMPKAFYKFIDATITAPTLSKYKIRKDVVITIHEYAILIIIIDNNIKSKCNYFLE